MPKLHLLWPSACSTTRIACSSCTCVSAVAVGDCAEGTDLGLSCSKVQRDSSLQHSCMAIPCETQRIHHPPAGRPLTTSHMAISLAFFLPIIQPCAKIIYLAIPKRKKKPFKYCSALVCIQFNTSKYEIPYVSASVFWHLECNWCCRDVCVQKNCHGLDKLRHLSQCNPLHWRRCLFLMSLSFLNVQQHSWCDCIFVHTFLSWMTAVKDLPCQCLRLNCGLPTALLAFTFCPLPSSLCVLSTGRWQITTSL